MIVISIVNIAQDIGCADINKSLQLCISHIYLTIYAKYDRSTSKLRFYSKRRRPTLWFQHSR